MKASRRGLMAGGAALAATSAAASAQTPEPPRERQTFVLVHGTWLGGWIWKDVRNLLEDRGHRVFTPTLTGCGERVHLSSPDVGLETHIADITNVLRYEELEDVVLVGHSFTGVAITGVADRMREKIGHLVYYDAIVPSETRRSGVPRDENGEIAAYFRKRQEKFADGYKMSFWDEYPIEMLVPADDPIVPRVRKLITTHPMRGWTDELTLENGGWEGLPRSFVHCVGQEYAMSSEAMVGPARAPGWNFIELDTPRLGMMTRPALVADLLERIHTGLRSVRVG